MLRYLTHSFASRDTLLRAVRWLMLLGFDPGEIEVNEEGVHRVSVLASSSQSAATAERIFGAVECSDPEGWPSFWDLSRKTFEPREIVPSPIVLNVPPVKTAPIGWHPQDEGAV
jgi:hypothetical protein